MHPRVFRLLEKHQRIDELLHRAEHRADNSKTVRLGLMKLKVRQLIHRFAPKPALS